MAVVAMVRAVAIDRSLWFSSCAPAGLASATARATPAKRLTDFTIPSHRLSFARYSLLVIPAKAGIHLSAARTADLWIPAYAGMTSDKAVRCYRNHSFSSRLVLP